MRGDLRQGRYFAFRCDDFKNPHGANPTSTVEGVPAAVSRRPLRLHDFGRHSAVLIEHGCKVVHRTVCVAQRPGQPAPPDWSTREVQAPALAPSIARSNSQRRQLPVTCHGDRTLSIHAAPVSRPPFANKDAPRHGRDPHRADNNVRCPPVLTLRRFVVARSLAKSYAMSLTKRWLAPPECREDDSHSHRVTTRRM